MHVGQERFVGRAVAVPIGFIAQGQIASDFAQHAQQIRLRACRCDRARCAQIGGSVYVEDGFYAAQIVQPDNQQHQRNQNAEADRQLAADIEPSQSRRDSLGHLLPRDQVQLVTS